VSSEDWDRISIDGGGQPLGRLVKIYRNGSFVPGVVSFSLSADVDGVVTLVTTQYVQLEGVLEVQIAKEEPDAE
jgi:hypothetical protein